MKKIISLLLTALIVFAPVSTFAEPETDNNNIIIENSDMTPPDVSHAEAAALMDMKTGRVLYGKNIQEKLFPASTTKMMTGILALEKGKLDDVITATYEAIKDITIEDSHMGILIGEELTMEQLINGMLVYSANDAANVIAINIAGSVSAFADMMNQKAAELGMYNTHFVNACGIQADEHYTTAEDLAILAKYCMQNEKFREIVKQSIYNIPPTNKYTKERNLPNTNLFLSRSPYNFYQPCIGIKTGHTSQAGYCLVSAAEHKDISLIGVVLKCANQNEKEKAYSYMDSKNMFEFGFNNYTSKKISSPGDVIADSKVYEAKDNMRVAFTVKEDIFALVPTKAESEDIVFNVERSDDELKAPIAKGTVLGKVTYMCNGAQLASADLVAANDVEQDKILFVIHFVVKIITSPFFFIPVILLIIIAIISNNQKKKRMRKKRLNQLKHNKQRGVSRTPDRNAARTEIRESETKGSNSRYTER